MRAGAGTSGKGAAWMALAAAALLWGACGGIGPPDHLEPLVEVGWELVAIEGTDAQPVEGPEGVPSLRFRPESAGARARGRRLAGDTGCNLLGGGYTAAADGSLALDGLAWTERACLEPGLMDLEQAFLAVLLRVDSWDVEGSELVLRAPDAALRFRRVAAG